jgi:hypothetical protein
MLTLWSLLLSLALFVGMLVAGAVGHRLAVKRAAREPGGAPHGAGVVDGAVFGLLGLIVALSFSGAVSRFDERRHLEVEEANAIGTAYLRIDLLPVESQAAVRGSMRTYLQSRLKFYQALPDTTAADAELETTKTIQSTLWTQVLDGTRDHQPATMLVLPAFNEMFDIATSRTMAIGMHPPPIIFGMMFALALVAAGLAGYGSASAHSFDWLRIGAFAAVTAFAFSVIIDIEFPRAGFIRVDSFDQVMTDLRDTIK